jgi:GMP synthase, PP-ATPase domain/subunit
MILEKKRKIIGNLFIKIFEKNSKKISNIKYLTQGDFGIPNVIENKSVTGKPNFKKLNSSS